MTISSAAVNLMSLSASGRDHKSNGVKMTVDISARVVYQTCWWVFHRDRITAVKIETTRQANLHEVLLLLCWPIFVHHRDPDCRGYQSPAVPIPPEALSEQEACRLTGQPPPSSVLVRPILIQGSAADSFSAV
jgi:hypothetical protein